MTMLERVAKALYKHEQGERTLDECMLAGRLIIETLMEPTDEMLIAGYDAPINHDQRVDNRNEMAKLKLLKPYQAILKAVLEGK